ncbi:MAG: hypothetical protein ACLFUI_09525 [Halanaerobiales bacterium]
MKLKWEIRQHRKKILIIFALMLCVAVFVILYYPYYLNMVESGFIETQPESYQREFQMQRDFDYFLTSNWFDKNLFQFTGILAILLAIGAVTEDRKNNLLSIYISRYGRCKYFIRKLINHLIILFVSGYAATILLAIFSQIQGHSIHYLRLNLSYLMSFVRMAFIYGIGLLASSISRNRFLTGTIGFVSVTVILYLTPDLFNVFSYMNISSYYTGSVFPVQGFIITTLLSVILYMLYYLIFRRMELNIK